VIPRPTNKVNDEIRRIFGRLESWRLLLHCEQRGPSPEASHRFLPKRYLFDTGVLRHLRDKVVPPISLAGTLNAAERRPLGGIVENQAAIELADRFGELAGWKVRGLSGYMQIHTQPLGVMVSLAPLGLVDSSGGGKILNVPLYLAERIPELVRGQG
jgi:hypothetical protein